MNKFNQTDEMSLQRKPKYGCKNRGMTGKETYLMWMDWKNQYC